MAHSQYDSSNVSSINAYICTLCAGIFVNLPQIKAFFSSFRQHFYNSTKNKENLELFHIYRGFFLAHDIFFHTCIISLSALFLRYIKRSYFVLNFSWCTDTVVHWIDISVFVIRNTVAVFSILIAGACMDDKSNPKIEPQTAAQQNITNAIELTNHTRAVHSLVFQIKEKNVIYRKKRWTIDRERAYVRWLTLKPFAMIEKFGIKGFRLNMRIISS